MQKVEVTWLDSMMLNYGEWADRQEHEEAMESKNMEHRSCGYLFSDGEDAIIIAHTIYEQQDALPDRAAGAMLIPRCAVRSISYLREDNATKAANPTEGG